MKKFRNYLQGKKKEFIKGKRVIDWEADMSSYNRKTTDFKKFKEYIKNKNKINKILSPFYQRYMFRRIKMLSFIGTKRTESKMINEFKKIFGSPDDVIITIGDWNQHSHMKYKEPVKGKGFRKVFRKAGYKVFLVDEFRTSCRCSDCEGECSTFRYCENPRPYKSGTILRHGLVKCQTCSRLWNRDMNAGRNIYKIAMCAIEGKNRPEYLCRKKSQ